MFLAPVRDKMCIRDRAGTETNFVLWIKDSSTGMLIGSLAGEKEAKAAFERLTITLE